MVSKTIRLSEELIAFFDDMKVVPTESYSSVLDRLVAWFYKYKSGYIILKKYFEGIEDNKDKKVIAKKLKALGLER